MQPAYLTIGQLVLFVFLEGMFLLLVWAYFKLHKDHETMREQAEEMHRKLSGDKDVILQEAQVEAKKLMDESRRQAEAIVSRAQEFGQLSNEALNKLLVTLSDKQAEVSNQVIGRVRDETVTLLQKLIVDLEQHASGELQGFGESLKKELEAARNASQASLDQAYGIATKEIEAYKQQRIKQVTVQMTILVREIVEKVIGKSVDERQHEELVIQAIEEAKQDGIL